MMIPRARWRALMLLAGCLCLSGCFPLLDSGSEEEKNPLITDARAKKAAYNYPGAIESLEKALEANPRSALAHWELGLLCYQNVEDYSGAIYHFERLLKLKPDFKQKEQVRDFINVCKIQLAKTAPLGPNTPQIQREIDKLAGKHLELTQENAQLKERVRAWQLQVQQLQAENAQLKQQLRESQNPAPPPLPRQPAPHTNDANHRGQVGSLSTTQAVGLVTQAASSRPSLSVTNPPPSAGAMAGRAAPGRPVPGPIVSTQAPPVVAPRPSPAPTPAPQAQAPAVRSRPRTHVVRERETLSSIARAYGIKLAALLAANPGVEPRRLKAGQVIQLP
jgi:tetratricopeptide (TPR) repeat protein